MTITVQHTISMGHRLPSYPGDCSSPHGHNMRVEVSVNGRFDEFVDFKLVKSSLKTVMEDMDHAMILVKDDPLLPVLIELGFRTYRLREEPTTEAIAEEICRLMQVLRYDVQKVVVHETENYSVTLEVGQHALPSR